MLPTELQPNCVSYRDSSAVSILGTIDKMGLSLTLNKTVELTRKKTYIVPSKARSDKKFNEKILIKYKYTYVPTYLHTYVEHFCQTSSNVSM